MNKKESCCTVKLIDKGKIKRMYAYRLIPSHHHNSKYHII